ncbi:Reticulon-domain-containing protein [Gaertneriomyces semiglobifer]|nr:Reticulon-domain-containing protein [Gaertneriomyces semiglobifer]
MLWQNPLQSATSLALILGSTYVLSAYHPMHTLLFLLITATAVNFAFVNAWTLAGNIFFPSPDGVRKPPTMFFLDRANAQPILNKSSETFQDITNMMVEFLNDAWDWTRSIVAIDDNARSLKALAGLTVFYYLSSMVTFKTLFIIGVLSAYTIPRVYLWQKDGVDKTLARGRAQIDEAIHRARAVSDSYGGKVKEAVGAFKDSAKTKYEETVHSTRKHAAAPVQKKEE